MSSTAEVAEKYLRAMFALDVKDLAPRVSCPTLVSHCRGDQLIFFDQGRKLAALIPGARFVPLESANHLLLESEPAWRRFVEEVEAFLPGATSGSASFAGLTRRELDLVELIAQGRDNAQIAATLGLTDKTVRNHITHIYAKLEVENRAQAIVLARNAGFGRS